MSVPQVGTLFRFLLTDEGKGAGNLEKEPPWTATMNILFHKGVVVYYREGGLGNLSRPAFREKIKPPSFYEKTKKQKNFNLPTPPPSNKRPTP